MIFSHSYFGRFFLFFVGMSTGIASTELKDAEITTMKNIVEHDAGSGPAPAKVNEKIGENSKVTTAAASMAELTFGDSSITRIGANSVFSFQSKERLVKLDKGTALIHATPGNGGATVDCGGVTAAVSGSTFMASRSASGASVFVLLESSGSLKVTTPGGQTAVILPGQAASTGVGPKSSIQVFDVDVKKVMETTPLVQGFKKELPSQAEINVVTEKQQAMIREGKIEVLGVEVVATGQDGDLLVGAPRERPEPGAGGDGLDINTAAGGEGPGAVAGAKPPPPPGAGPSMNAAGQRPGLDSSFLAAQRRLAETGPQGPTQLKVTLPDGISEGTLQAGTISLNSPAVQAVPVTLVSASGRNITFNFPEGSTIPVGATSIPFTFTVADDGIISNGSSNLVALSIQAFASKLSTVGGGLVADSTSRVPSGFGSKDPLEFGSSINPFTIQLPGELAADLESTVKVESFIRDEQTGEAAKIGEVVKKVLIQAGQKTLELTGNILPDTKIYSSALIEAKITVALGQIGQSFESEYINIQPRNLKSAVIQAANPIRSLLATAYTSIKWDSLPEATAYEIKVTQGNVVETKLLLGTAYDWLGGFASNAKAEVTALTSEIKTGALSLVQLADVQLKRTDITVRKGSLEILIDVVNAAGEQINSIVMKDNGSNTLWFTDSVDGQEKLGGSVQYDTGVVSLSEDALAKDQPNAEVYYSASFVGESSFNLSKEQIIETSAGPSESDLLQFDKYFYFTDKAGVEGPTKFFADVKDPAPERVDLANSSNWRNNPTSWLDSNRSLAVDFGFYAAKDWIFLNDVGNKSSQPGPIVFNSDKVVLFADKISLLGEFVKSDLTRTVLNVSVKESAEKALTLIGGKDGIDVRNVELNVNGADLTMETASGVSVDSSKIEGVGNKFEVNAATSVQIGAAAGASQVTVQAKSETANSMAVIRTGDSLELRRVVLKSFARGEIVSVSAANKGRVLLSAATARDFRINELVNAVIVADNKGQTVTTSPDIVAQGVDLTVEGTLPIKTAKYNLGKDASGIDQFADVHGHNINLEASRIHLAKAQITAVNAITAKAQTLVVDNSFLRVVNALGSINLYSTSGKVNEQYGTVVDGLVNFSGANTFSIGNRTVSIANAQQLQAALGSNGMINRDGSAPAQGMINILSLENVSATTTSHIQ
jgi:hypothetical protein